MNLIRNKYVEILGKLFVAAFFVIFAIAVMSATIIFLQGQPSSFLSSKWTVEIAGESSMLLYSFFVMLLISRGRFALYGFRFPQNIPWRKVLSLGLGVGILASLLGFFLNHGEQPLLFEFSFLQTIVIIWICGTVAEEVLMRGLVQGYLNSLQPYGISIAGVRISLPVFVAAVYFGLMHMGLLTMGASGSFVMFIVLFTFFIGLIAGYYREKTGSLIPALIVHFMANVGGGVLDYILEYLKCL